MFNKYEALIDDMLKSISNLGISEHVICEIEKCFNGEIEEDEVYRVLDDINIDSLDHKNERNIVECMNKLIKSGDKEICSKGMRILFYICKDLTFDVYNVAVSDIFGNDIDKIHETFQEYDIPFYYYILNKAKVMQERRYMDSSYINQLKKLHSIDREQFILAYKYAHNVPKIFLGAVGVIKDDEFVEELGSWVEESIRYNFKMILKSFGLNEDYISIVEDYINGQDHKLDEIIKVLKTNFDKSIYDYYTSTFTIFMTYITYYRFKESERILKLLLLFNSKYTLTELSEMYPLDELNENGFIDRLGIPTEYYIAFLGYHITFLSKRYFANERLEEYCKKYIEGVFQKDKESVKKAISLSSDTAMIFLASYFWNIGEGEEFINTAKEKFLNIFKKVLQDKEGFSKDEIHDFTEYLKGNKQINEILIPKNRDNIYIYAREYGKAFDLLFLIKNNSDIVHRIVNYIVEIGKVYAFQAFSLRFFKYVSENEDDLLELIKNLNIKIYKLVPILTGIVCNTNRGIKPKMQVMLDKLFENNTQEVLSNIGLCDIEGRKYWITKISEKYSESDIDKEDYYKVLAEFAGDSSKVIRQTVFRYIEENKECIDKIVPLLNNKKAVVRESAVKILGDNINDDYRKSLEDRLEKEKSNKVKNLIMEYLNIEKQGKEDANINIFEYCKKNLDNRKKANVEWLKPLEFSKLKLKDSKEDIDQCILYYILLSFVDNKEVKLNIKAKNIATNIDEESLKDFAFEVLSKWIDGGAEAKKRWVLSLVGMFGDTRVVTMLNDYIKKWAESSRGAVASEAVKALALQGSDEALMLVDSMSRKFKHKQVKRAAGEALEFAAKELGINKDELADRLVSTLNFDKAGQRIFYYGNRKFIVEINPELQLSVYKEDGKQLKNLPAVGKNDNEEMAKKAREEFKLLKKQLKTLVATQTQRLESALSVNRKWISNKWEKLFIENVIMQRFALGLIWGVYEGNDLIQSFRYMEDGTFNTVDEEEYEVPENANIGLVHPIELTEADIEAWNEQLEDYEIKQPFEQLTRKVFKMSEQEKEQREIEQFGGIILNEYQMLNFEKLCWNKGEILDAGGYYEFYKENKSLGIRAEIRHSGLCVGYFMGEDVTIYELVFYKTEDFKIVYGYNRNNNCLYIKDVPQRFLSEIMYDVYKVTLRNSGKNENWKKER